MGRARATAAGLVALLTIAVGVLTEFLGDHHGATMLIAFGVLVTAAIFATIWLERLGIKRPENSAGAPGAGRADTPASTPQITPPGSGTMTHSRGTQNVIGGSGSIGVAGKHVTTMVGMFIGGFVGVVAIVAAVVLLITDDSTGDSPRGLQTTPSAPPPVLAVLRADARPDHLVRGEFDDIFPYFIPHPAHEVGPPPEEARCKERKSWAWAQGGADWKETWAKLTLENTRQRQVTVADIRVEVLSRAPLPAGMVALCTTGGGDPDRTLGLHVNLNPDMPSVTFVAKPEGPEKPLPGWKLNPGDQDTFNLLAKLEEPVVVHWRLIADVIADGATSQLIVDDHGAPFRTAGRGAPVCREGDTVGEATAWSCSVDE